MVICAGLDLAAKPHRPSGLAIIEARSPLELRVLNVSTVYTNHEIVEALRSSNVDMVAIDSPLSMPSSVRGYRDVDIEMIRHGFRVLPPRWRSMTNLTLRAMELTEVMRNLGVKVVETHPLSALKSSRCRSLSALTRRINLDVERCSSKHEADAVVAAIVCVFHFFKMSLTISAADGLIVLLPPLC
ncbi:MAG: DUF429 domain-containing protein [Desulfurococcaceae archaeon]